MQEKEISAAVARVLQSLSDMKMTLSLAQKITKAVLEEAERKGVNAVVAISNEGARPVSVQAMDGSFIASYDIALNKAYTSAALKMSTKELKTLSAPGGPLYGVQNTNGGQSVIFGGGEPLFCNGKVIGALGVSGGTEEQDTALAAFGKDFFIKELSK